MEKAKFRKLDDVEKNAVLTAYINSAIWPVAVRSIIAPDGKLPLPPWEPYAGYATAKQKRRLWKEGITDQTFIEMLSVDQASELIGLFERKKKSAGNFFVIVLIGIVVFLGLLGEFPKATITAAGMLLVGGVAWWTWRFRKRQVKKRTATNPPKPTEHEFIDHYEIAMRERDAKAGRKKKSP